MCFLRSPGIFKLNIPFEYLTINYTILDDLLNFIKYTTILKNKHTIIMFTEIKV